MSEDRSLRGPQVHAQHESVTAYSPAWLAMREPADAAARADELLSPLRNLLHGRLAGGDLAGADLAGADLAGGDLVIGDLGCGTGSMGRWLAGRLPGPQHWILYDRDPDLLHHAAANLAAAEVTVETRQQDVAALTAADLTGASLVTASALLDLLTREEVDRLAAACLGAGCPALLTLSVVGAVEFTPADPLDLELAAAFSDHQRRVVDGRRLLGPDAVDATAEAFRRRGATVQEAPSPWRLGAAQSGLIGEWLRGWVGAACEQRPELADPAAAYLDRRLAAAATGKLRVRVGHRDLLAYAG